MLNELSTILISVISTALPCGSITGFLYWRQNKKIKESEVRLKESEVSKARIESKSDEWHLYKEQLQVANERIKELLEVNREKESRLMEKDKLYAERINEVEERFNKQTEHLRKIQRMHRESLEEINRLTIEKGKMQRIIDHLRQWFCMRCFKDCKRRKPEQAVKPTEYTPLPDTDADLEKMVKNLAQETKDAIENIDIEAEEKEIAEQ